MNTSIETRAIEMSLSSNEAEQSVIGALLLQQDAFDRIHWLNPSAFFFANNRKIYNAICQLINDAKPVDVITVAEYLDENGELGNVGGVAYIGSLASNVPGAGNIKRYAEIVLERSTVRSLMAAVNEIQQDLQNPGSVEEKLQRAQALVMNITEKSQSSEPVFVGDLVADRINRFDDLMNGVIKNVGTGFNDLDRLLGGGLCNGDLIIIAARPSMGKTALAIQLAEKIQHKDAAALVFSCEMANGQIVDRLISAHSKISSDKLRTGDMQDEDINRLVHSAKTVKSLNMLVDDKTFNINSLRAKARTIKRKHGLSCVVVDYIQLLSGEGNNREQEVSGFSRGLKALAKELDIPVIALSQLSRKVEDRADKRPVMSDLRESGAIEQDADIIAFIYRDEYYNPDSPYKGTAEVNIAKHRNGKTGKVIFTFDGEHTTFLPFVGTLPEPRREAPKPRGFPDE